MAVTSLNDIPFYLLEDILSRVPVETLKPLCCINKTWYNLIHSSYFISKHHSHQSTSNVKLLVARFDDDRKTCFSFLSKDEGHHYSLVDLPTPFLTNGIQKYIVGPCINGFVCVKIGSTGLCPPDLAFWNIANGEYHILPKLNLPYPPYIEPSFDGLGFGWVPDTNEYKVILSIFYWDDSRDHPKYSCCDLTYPGCPDPEFYVYTLGTNSWKQLTFEIPLHTSDLNSYPPDHSQICVNGVCYWVNQPYKENHKILFFHMRDEVFGSLELPDFETQKKADVSYTLSMLDGCLALIINHAGTVRYLQSSRLFDDFWLDVWVMDVTWIKKLKIGPFFNISTRLGLVEDEFFFMKDGSEQLLSFNSKLGEVMNINICTSTYQVLKYVESLVSIKRSL